MYTKALGVLHHLPAMRPADILWPFLITVSQPENLFNYRYKERLEKDSVVGKLVEKKRLNNLVYVE